MTVGIARRIDMTNLEIFFGYVGVVTCVIAFTITFVYVTLAVCEKNRTIFKAL